MPWNFHMLTRDHKKKIGHSNKFQMQVIIITIETIDSLTIIMDIKKEKFILLSILYYTLTPTYQCQIMFYTKYVPNNAWHERLNFKL